MAEGDLDRFISTQTFTPVAIASTAPSFSAWGNVFNNIQSAAAQDIQKKADKDAQKQGALAGEQPGFKPIKETGEASEIFNRSALQVNKQLSSSQISIHSSSLLAQANLQPDANQGIQQYKAGMAAWAKTYIQNVPDANKPFVNNYIQYHLANGLNKLQKKVLTQNSLKNFSLYTINQTQYRNDYLQAIQSGEYKAADDIVGQKINASKQALLSGLITKNEYAGSFNNDYQQLNENKLIEGYKLALQDGKGQDYIKQVSSQNISGLDEIQKSNLIKNKFSAVRFDALNSQGLDKQSIVSLAQNNIAQVESGGSPNHRVLTLAHDYLDESDFNKITSQYENAKSIYDGTNTAKRLNISQQQQWVDTNYKPSVNDPDFKNKQTIYEQILKNVSQFNHQVRTDPVQAMSTLPSVQSAIQHSSNMNVTGANHLTNANNDIHPPAYNTDQSIYNAQIQHGISPSDARVLTNSSAKNIVSQVQQMSPDQMLEFFDKFKQTHQQFTQIAMKDLVRAGLRPNAQFVIGNDPGDPLMVDYSRMMNTSNKDMINSVGKEKYDELQSLVNNPPTHSIFGISSDSGNWESYIQSKRAYKSTGSVTKHLNQLKGFINGMALSIMSGNPSISPKDALNEAIEFSPIGKFNYTTLSGSTVAIPKQYDVNSVEFSANQKEKELKDFPWVVGPNIISQTLPKQRTPLQFNPTLQKSLPPGLKEIYDLSNIIRNKVKDPEGTGRDVIYNSTIKTGHWVTNSTNDGLVWVTSNGNLVVDKKGNPFQLKFSDITHHSSSEVGKLLLFSAL